MGDHTERPKPVSRTSLAAPQRLRRADLIWLLAYPLYQILGTIRHEGSHALAVILTGEHVDRFVFWPSMLGGRFFWGYVIASGDDNWAVWAAPYLCDLATFATCFVVCSRVAFARHWAWVNVVVLGLISPLVNSAYEYIKGLRGDGDVAGLAQIMPPMVVHAYFVLTLLIYCVGLAHVLGLWSWIARRVMAARQGGRVGAKAN
jgi:hypothetical protein